MSIIEICTICFAVGLVLFTISFNIYRHINHKCSCSSCEGCKKSCKDIKEKLQSLM